MGAARRVVVLRPSRDLCGTTPEQFADLLARLAPLADEAKARREARQDRKRAPGAGRKPVPLAQRLLVALTHLRQGSTTRATAVVFGIHERSVRNFRDEITGLLAEHGCQPPGAKHPIRTLHDLGEYLDEVDAEYAIVDATEVPRSMPVDWDAQRRAYSGKTRTHVHKGTVVADPNRRPVWFEANPIGEGRTHDYSMLRGQLGLMALLAGLSVTLLADKGYQGLRRDLGDERVLTPWIKPRRGELSDDDRDANHLLSSLRMPVEHAIGRMKWWRAMRHWRASIDRFAITGKAIATLASLT
jgi:hypothetical protein